MDRRHFLITGGLTGAALLIPWARTMREEALPPPAAPPSLPVLVIPFGIGGVNAPPPDQERHVIFTPVVIK